MTLDSFVSQFLSNALLSTVGLALLHFVWQGALLALGLLLLLHMFRPERAELRYALACGTLLLMAVAPLATFGGLYGFYGGSSPVTNPAMLEPPIRAVEPVDEAQGDEALTPTPAPAQQVAPATLVSKAPRPLGSFSSYASLDVGRVAPYLTLLWGLGVLLLTLRLLGGVWVSARLGRRGQLAPARYQQRLLELSRHLGVKGTVRLLESGAVAVPVVAGWLKPVILLPSSALSGLTPLQLEMILAHELAHVRRRDPLVNALQHLVETALFYHPAVWWVSHVMRQERESCCDDIATRLCGDPLAYAETLARLERLRSPGPLVLAGSGGRLKRRIERLVGVRRAPAGSPLVTFGLALGLVCSLGVAGVLAQSDAASSELGTTVSTHCQNPYFPVAEGSVWSYTELEASDNTTFPREATITELTNDSFVRVETFETQNSSETDRTLFICSPEGLSGRLTEDFIKRRAEAMGTTEPVEFHSEGVQVPSGEWQPGYSWTYTFGYKTSSGVALAEATMTSTIVSEDSLQVPAGRFDAFRVDLTVDVAELVDGQQVEHSFEGSDWYAKDVGLVKRRLVGKRDGEVVQDYELGKYELAQNTVDTPGDAGMTAQSGGAAPATSPVASPTLPERSLWVDILGDVRFTDDYLGVADVREDGVFVLEERRNGQPYRLLMVMGRDDLPVQTTAEKTEYLVGESGGPSFIYAEGGEADFNRNGSGR